MPAVAAAPTVEPAPPAPTGWRAAVVWIVAVAIALATASGIVAWQADDQFYEPDILLEAFADLPEDPERAREIATWLAEEAIRSLRLDERLDELLPFGLGVVAGPIVNVLEDLAVRTATQVVGSDFFAEVWADALPGVRDQLVLLQEGSDEGLLTTSGGSVVVDLDRAILAAYDLMADAIPDIPDDSLFARVTGIDTRAIKESIGDFLERALPETLTGFPLIGAETLERIEKWRSQLDLIAWLSVVTILAAGAAALLTDPRRALVIGAIIGGVVAGIGLGLVAIAWLESAIVDALRSIPWDGGGPTVDGVLDWWLGGLIIAIVLSLVPLITRFVGGMPPAPGRHGPSGQ